MEESTIPTQSKLQAEYRFTETQDWVSFHAASWKTLLPLETSDAPRVLEIGSWEGRSAVFLIENVCREKGEMVCIDHFDLFQTRAGRERFETIKHNLSLTGKKFRILPQFSFPALMDLLTEEMMIPSGDERTPGFDWIYVDGSHEADDTVLDGELAWRLAKKGAIFIFDDYHWNTEPEDSIHHPKRGIDAFLELHRGEYELISKEENYQVVLKKLTEMRIGFLVPEKVKDDAALDTAAKFGYGIHVAFAINSSFAMAAGVAIRSLVEKTLGRITIYLIDLGLGEEDRLRLLRSSERQDRDHAAEVTLKFITLDDDSLARSLGPTWAKLDVFQQVPVERVLYLDADVLIRSSVKPLWELHLHAKSIGAAVDIGYPMGHGGMKRGLYLNAGVLLIDLAKARHRFNQLHDFADDWHPLHLSWNAQGLGTYVKYPSDDRKIIDLGELEDPKIVHFTGPVHPNMEKVMNPWGQPVTAKPWGYAGAPGHPYEKEWWNTLKTTPWGDTAALALWKQECKLAKQKAAEIGVQAFYEMLEGRI